MATRIILDCDPGIDDALAIAFAHGHPGIELAGITTVAGNVGLARTTANALAVCEFTGAAGTRATPGCAEPLLRPAAGARQVARASALARSRGGRGGVQGRLDGHHARAGRNPADGGDRGGAAADERTRAARLRAAAARPRAVPVGQRAWRPARARRLRGGVGGGARSVR